MRESSGEELATIYDKFDVNTRFGNDGDKKKKGDCCAIALASTNN